jgi:peptidoglycan LD-endopeptidase LytH
MRSFIFAAAIIFATFVFINNFDSGNENAGATKIVNDVAAPFRYAALVAKEPESKIEIPIRGVRKKQIADTFGAPRGADRTHQGQDIFAARNTPVYSATEGYVWRLGENNLGGRTVWILGAGGRVYYYAHLEKYAENLTVGDRVTTQTVIGYVGTSGNARGTPPHLHFGVYTSAGAIDPLELFE